MIATGSRPFRPNDVDFSNPRVFDSDTLLINRRRYVLHPLGVKFTSASVAGDSPTNAELETGSNWVRVRENKNVRVVAVTHN